MKNRLVLVLSFLIVLLSVSCSKKESKPDDEEINIIPAPLEMEVSERFTPDTLSVIKNPCTGWGVYCDNFIPEDPIDYYNKLEQCGALDYATHMYIRVGWAKYEIEEGVYAWNVDGPFKTLIEETKRRGLKLAFRVYYDNRDYNYQVTPLYVKKAGAEGYLSNTNFWTPYADDPVFKAKLETFISAFAKEFDDPAIVDYVDGFGLGIWGEGFGATYKDPSNKDEVLYWLTETFAKAFSKVMLVINAHEDIGMSQLQKILGKYDFVTRHDAYGSVNHRYFGSAEQNLIKGNFPERFVIAESMYWLSAGPGTNAPIRDGYKDWREAMEYTFNDAKMMRANNLDLRNYLECSLLWFKDAKDLVDEFARKGGYRLAPVEISFLKTARQGETITIRHQWKNWGWGVCPNNNSRWNYKFKTAFALLDPKDNSVVEIFIDESGEPSSWLLETENTYDYKPTISAPAGNYLLATAIVDTNNLLPGLKLAVKDCEFVNDWLIVSNITIK